MDPCTQFATYHDPKLNWDDLEWIKGMSNGLPIYLKGVASIEVGRPVLWLMKYD
jgi:isopentenyl diphosphate isomerase/L-lactate dehydrogenase-like FMN-dependent dehydrogenase